MVRKANYFLLIAFLFILGCAHQKSNGGVVFQNAPFSMLLAGDYDGNADFDRLKAHGDFGIGTVEGLDGEVIGFDGNFYQIRSDGKVYPLNGKEKTPFATVTFFRSDKAARLNNELTLKELAAYLDEMLPDKDLFYAIRIKGKFKTVKARSVRRQEKPYPPLMQALQGQVVFEFNDVEGTMAGFRFPEYAQGINAAGYHFHFITEDKSAGGHLLDCRIEDVCVEADKIDKIFMDVNPQ